jgi:hypothetical protein
MRAGLLLVVLLATAAGHVSGQQLGCVVNAGINYRDKDNCNPDNCKNEAGNEQIRVKAAEQVPQSFQVVVSGESISWYFATSSNPLCAASNPLWETVASNMAGAQFPPAQRRWIERLYTPFTPSTVLVNPPVSSPPSAQQPGASPPWSQSSPFYLKMGSAYAAVASDNSLVLAGTGQAALLLRPAAEVSSSWPVGRWVIEVQATSPPRYLRHSFGKLWAHTLSQIVVNGFGVANDFHWQPFTGSSANGVAMYNTFGSGQYIATSGIAIVTSTSYTQWDAEPVAVPSPPLSPLSPSPPPPAAQSPGGTTPPPKSSSSSSGASVTIIVASVVASVAGRVLIVGIYLAIRASRRKKAAKPAAVKMDELRL